MEINSNTSPVALNQLYSTQQKQSSVAGKSKQVESSVASPTPETQKEASQVVLNKVEAVNSQLNLTNLGLTFLVDESTQSSVVKVVDKATDEVIRQFPTDGSLKIMSNIQSYLDSVQSKDYPTKAGLTGLLLNEVI